MDPESPPQPIESSVQKPQKRLPLLPALLSVLLLLLASTGFLAYQNMLLTKQIVLLPATPSIAPIPTPISIPTTDPQLTAGWKEQNFGTLTFKIPSTWKSGNCAYLGVEGIITAFGPPEKDPSKCESNGVFQIIRNDKPLSVIGRERNKVTILLAGVSAAKIQVENTGGSETKIFFNKNNTYYQINFYESAYLKVFDQILSTFKFTQ